MDKNCMGLLKLVFQFISKYKNIARHLSNLHKICVFVQTISFFFKLHYIKLVFFKKRNKVLTIKIIYLETQHILQEHLRKRKSGTSKCQFYIPLEFQIKNYRICLRLTDCTNNISVLKTKFILLGLSNALRNPFLYYWHICLVMKTGLHIYCETTYYVCVVNQIWIIKLSKLTI